MLHLQAILQRKKADFLEYMVASADLLACCANGAEVAEYWIVKRQSNTNIIQQLLPIMRRLLRCICLCLNYTHLIDKLSTHNQFQWDSGGRNTQLCSPHVRVVAAPAVNAAQSREGTPTVQKTQLLFLDLNNTMYNIKSVSNYNPFSPKGIVPRLLSAVFSGTSLQLYHKPINQTQNHNPDGTIVQKICFQGLKKRDKHENYFSKVFPECFLIPTKPWFSEI